MTAAMLATYPDVFAARAVIVGLTFGTASSVSRTLRGCHAITSARIFVQLSGECRRTSHRGHPVVSPSQQGAASCPPSL